MTSNSRINALVALATAIAMATVLAMALAWAAWPRRPDAEQPPAVDAAPADDDAPQIPADAAVSIGSQVCAECHAEIVADYARSGMSRTWRAAAAGTLPELTANADVEDLVSRYRYRVAVSGSGIEQIETRDDNPRHALRRQARYLVGSGKNAVAAVAAERGYLTQMPVAWFRHDHAWRMNPGFELYNHRFDRPITPGCIACHGTAAVHEPPTANRFQEPIAAGIDCQRCHGSAAQHVAFWSTEAVGKTHPDSTIGAAAATLGVSVGMQPAQANDLCLQCHLQGDATVYQADSGPLQLRPGDRLRDHRHDFLVDSGERSALGIASHGARMLRSRCYLESGGRLTCVLCHDPHKPAADFDAAYYDGKCATCHAPESCRRTEEPPRTSPATGCVNCHLPQRSSREGIHLVFTDHAIVRHRASWDAPDLPATALTPNAVGVKLVSAWPDDNPEPAILGAAYVRLHETLGPQLPALERGADLLAEAIRRNRDDGESRFWLGSALAGLGRGEAAIPLLAQVSRDQPDRHLARFRLAIAYELVGDYDRAIAHYRQLVERVPSWIEPYPRLAQLYLARHQSSLATDVLKRQLAYRHDALAYAQLSLAERMAGGSHTAALARIAEAIRLDPRLPAVYVHRAALHLLADRPDAAKADFQRVLQLDPRNQRARDALDALAGEQP